MEGDALSSYKCSGSVAALDRSLQPSKPTCACVVTMSRAPWQLGTRILQPRLFMLTLSCIIVIRSSRAREEGG
jgi:hypothetical protein